MKSLNQTQNPQILTGDALTREEKSKSNLTSNLTGEAKVMYFAIFIGNTNFISIELI